MSKTAKTVVWWRYFERHQEVMTRSRFDELVRSWEMGDCSISTIDGREALDYKRGWQWDAPTDSPGPSPRLLAE